MFRELGLNAQELLGVVAFFPQGIREKNIERLFPTITNGANMFDLFCIFSLTCRSNRFVTLLALLRDYLRPEDPTSSPLLSVTEECYFIRLATKLHPSGPSSEESLWITSEDVNIEHLFDVFTSVDVESESV